MTSLHRLLSVFALLAVGLCVLTPAPVIARDVAGIPIEEAVTLYNNTLVLNGAGAVQGPKGPLYVAHIYAKQKFATLDALFAAPGPKRLTIVAVKEVDTAPIMKSFNRSMDVAASRTDMAKLIPGLVAIGNVFKTNKTLKAGEVMTFDWVPVYGLIIYVGGKLQGNPLREPELFRGAMGVWMGDNPLDAALKEALLGRG